MMRWKGIYFALALILWRPLKDREWGALCAFSLFILFLYWETVVKVTKVPHTPPLRDLDHAVMREKPNARWMGRFNLSDDNILMYFNIKEPLLAQMALIKAADEMSMS